MTELRTDRLILRPARPDDAPCYALGVGEFAVARWLTPLPWPYTLSMASDFLRQAPENSPDRALFIIEVPGKGLVGCISLIDELGFWIARPHWGRGYLTEAATRVLDYHFTGTGHDTLACSAQHDNRASLRVQAKLGFIEQRREMRFSQALQHNVPHIVTSLTRSEWLSRGRSRCA